ncbi:hypothetical protein LH935_14890 [Gordonia polyisoprenivorans]|uniref:hypothetical protein n=1 Tax=Gordonia polyisoprenivorans TaxID=84595 RepID=UPI0022340056|nr:hypothetical protein LH935_14890 [Gordonia polyisoprenivorans]
MSNVADEACRKSAGADVIAYYAKKNPSINPEMTHANIDMVVIDGVEREMTGPDDIAEALEYGWSRRDRLSRAIQGGEPGDPRAPRREDREPKGDRMVVLTAAHLPMKMCEPDGSFYQAVDEDTGKPKFYSKGQRNGQPVMVPRYRPRDMAEAMRYFQSYLDFHAELMPDGRKSIYYYSVQLDEQRPHLQIMSDTYAQAPTKKNPDALANHYSRVFGRDPRSDVKDPELSRPKLDADGNQVLDKRGKPVRVSIGVKGEDGKMALYHRRLKAHMLERGFEIEAEVDLERHADREEHGDFKRLQDLQDEVADQAEEIADQAAALTEAADVAAIEQSLLADDAASLVEAQTILDLDREALTDQHQALNAEAAAIVASAERVREEAVERGYADGLARGTADAQAQAGAIIENAQVSAEKITADAQTTAEAVKAKTLADAKRVAHEVIEDAKSDRDAAAQERAEAATANREAQERRDAIPVYDPRTAVRDMAAVRHDAGNKLRVVPLGRDGRTLKDAEGKAKVMSANEAIDEAAEQDWADRQSLGQRKPMPTETVGERGARTKATLQGGQSDLSRSGPVKSRDQSRGIGD